MLSARMAKVLQSVEFTGVVGSFRDGRTVHALRTRGLITKVDWEPALNTYTFKLTKRGKALSRQLRYINDSAKEELLS